MKTFEELGINPNILRAITEMGYEQPMPVQEAVIPLLLNENTDIVALAQTGTGKTAAFGLPIIQKTDTHINAPQTLILSPTRELCLQITGDINDYSTYIEGLKIIPVYGGSSIQSQIRSLRNGVHIIVATPGRLIDLMQRGVVTLDKVHTVVLDEADEMLNMGFTESIDEILSNIPSERNMLLFSATMPPEIARIARNYMRSPKEIVIGSKNEGAKNVKHVYYLVHAKDKYPALKRIADYYPNIYGIIFCRTRLETQEIADALIKDGYNADSLHGDLSQQQRDAVMQKFRLRNLQLLVATDVAARGLDVDDLTHVINYGLPEDIETYTHRSGRTGRARKTGTSIAIVHTKEKTRMRNIERIIGKQFEKGTVPSGKQICEKQLFNLIDRVEKVEVNEEEIATYLPPILKRLSWLSTEDLVKRVVSLEFNRLLEYYAGAKDLDIPEESKKLTEKSSSDRQRGRTHKPASGFTRLRINLGKADGFYPNTLIDIINRNITERRIAIGKIDIMPQFSYFEIEDGDTHIVTASLKNLNFFGKRIQIEDKDRNKNSKEKGNEKTRFHRKNKEFQEEKRGKKSFKFDDRRKTNKNFSKKNNHKIKE